MANISVVRDCKNHKNNSKNGSRKSRSKNKRKNDNARVQKLLKPESVLKSVYTYLLQPAYQKEEETSKVIDLPHIVFLEWHRNDAIKFLDHRPNYTIQEFIFKPQKTGEITGTYYHPNDNMRRLVFEENLRAAFCRLLSVSLDILKA